MGLSASLDIREFCVSIVERNPGWQAVQNLARACEHPQYSSTNILMWQSLVWRDPRCQLFQYYLESEFQKRRQQDSGNVLDFWRDIVRRSPNASPPCHTLA